MGVKGADGVVDGADQRCPGPNGVGARRGAIHGFERQVYALEDVSMPSISGRIPGICSGALRVIQSRVVPRSRERALRSQKPTRWPLAVTTHRRRSYLPYGRFALVCVIRYLPGKSRMRTRQAGQLTPAVWGSECQVSHMDFRFANDSNVGSTGSVNAGQTHRMSGWTGWPCEPL